MIQGRFKIKKKKKKKKTSVLVEKSGELDCDLLTPSEFADCTKELDSPRCAPEVQKILVLRNPWTSKGLLRGRRRRLRARNAGTNQRGFFSVVEMPIARLVSRTPFIDSSDRRLGNQSEFENQNRRRS